MAVRAVERSNSSIVYNATVDLHQIRESAARHWARAAVRWLRFRELREVALVEGFAESIAPTYGVSKDHTQLFAEIVRNTINADRLDAE
jgi:hypothetical protein